MMAVRQKETSHPMSGKGSSVSAPCLCLCYVFLACSIFSRMHAIIGGLTVCSCTIFVQFSGSKPVDQTSKVGETKHKKATPEDIQTLHVPYILATEPGAFKPNKFTQLPNQLRMTCFIS